MINWKLRFKNKTTLTALILGVIAIIYQILNVCGVIPKVDQQEVINIALMIVDVLCIIGVVVDPTTDGVGDSARALQYDEPHKDI